MKMSWTLFVGIVLLLSGVANSHPVSFDGESKSNINAIGNDILSQSQLSPSLGLLQGAEDSIADIPTSRDEEDFSTSANNNAAAADTTQYTESRSNEIADVLKGTILPADLAGEAKSSSSPIPRAADSTSEKPSDKTKSSSSRPSPVALVSSESLASTSPPPTARQYMSGDDMLDKIMNLIKWRWHDIYISSSAWKQLAAGGI